MKPEAAAIKPPPRFNVDWFLIGLLAAVAIASFAPHLGRTGGTLHLDQIGNVGIFAIFFLHGMALSTESLLHGASRWRLHLLVQLCTFAVFPLWWLAFDAAFSRFVPHDLMLGFFYLAILPSTVSSSVAMTGLARGNVAAAILNATLSTLLGVFLTPLLASLVFSHGAHPMDLGSTMMKIAQMLLLPFVLGQLLRPWLGAYFKKIKPVTSWVDRIVIMLLVWCSFSDSVADGLWTKNGLELIVLTLVGAALFLFPMLFFTRFVARLMKMPIEDEIVAVFCGSKKTLASGVPMARLLFGGNPALGALVLPIMFYHQLQLFVCSMLARKYAARVDPLMAVDFEAAVQAPFRMQPGLRRLAPGARQLRPNAIGDRALTEKLAVLSTSPGRALLCAEGFDAAPALAALCRHAATEHAAAWAGGDGGDASAPWLGWALRGGTPVALRDDAPAEVAACLAALPVEWRLPGLLALAFAEDFAIVDAASGRIPWLAVCLPSHWSPAEKIGRPFTEVHAPVADNTLIVKAADALMRLVTGAERWERFVWTITSHPRLDAHPQQVAAERWPAAASVDELAAAAYWRSEHQTFIPVPGRAQAVFTIGVDLQPLAAVIDGPARAAQLAAALASMSPAVLEYRSLTAARERLLAWLSARADR